MNMPDVAPIDYARLHQRKLARYQPKRTDDLLPKALPLIGQTFTFECADYGLEDDPFPGQYRWFAITEDGRLREDLHWWVPDEDLAGVL